VTSRPPTRVTSTYKGRLRYYFPIINFLLPFLFPRNASRLISVEPLLLSGHLFNVGSATRHAPHKHPKLANNSSCMPHGNEAMLSNLAVLSFAVMDGPASHLICRTIHCTRLDTQPRGAHWKGCSSNLLTFSASGLLRLKGDGGGGPHPTSKLDGNLRFA
jgi:hypothetical protein